MKKNHLKDINPFFPINDILKERLEGNNRNWWYEPTIEEISKECEYLLNLAWK